MRKLAISITILLVTSVLAGQQPDVKETNKAVAYSFFEQVFDKGQLDHYADSHASTFVAHGDGLRLHPRRRYGHRRRSGPPCPICA